MDDLRASAHRLAETLDAYEAHRLSAPVEPGPGHVVRPHADVSQCSDEGRHDPWNDVVRHWPGHDATASARRGLEYGAEVAVLVKDHDEVVVRYVAMEHRWIVDESHAAGRWIAEAVSLKGPRAPAE